MVQGLMKHVDKNRWEVGQNQTSLSLLSDSGQDIHRLRKGLYFLTPGPLDFLAHHGSSFITEAIPWLSAKLALTADNVGRVPSWASKADGGMPL